MGLRIALGLGLNVEEKRGLDSFYEGMLGGLAQADPENEYHLLYYFFKDYGRKLRALNIPRRPNFKLCAKRWPSRLVDSLEWSVGLPVFDWLFVGPGGFDLFHGMGSWLPRLKGIKTVVTIHDLMPERFQERALAEGRRPEALPSGRTGISARRADRVIATSSGTREDLAEFYGIDPAKVDVVLYGVDDAVFRPADDPAALAETRARYGLPGPFVLFMGPFQWRHNSERVLEALAGLRREGIGRDCLLAFVGTGGPYLDGLLAHARPLGLQADARVLGFVPREDLPRLYGLAAVVAHPTLYGGGLPVYEALACGGALLTSRTPESTMPEIVREAALKVDPTSVAEIASGLKVLLADPGASSALRRKARERGRELTWRRAAGEVLEVYRRVLACRGAE